MGYPSALVSPLLKTEPQREAARMLGKIGIGALGFGGTAALVMSLRRKNERALLDEEKAKALLRMPIYTDGYENPDETTNEKQAGIPLKGLAAGLGVLGVGTTIAGLASGDRNESNPLTRVYNTLVPGWVTDSVAAEGKRLSDLPGTIRGEHATKATNVPWMIPGAIALTALGIGGGYAGVNKLTDMLAKRKLSKKKENAKRALEHALAMEQRSKLGSVLDEFVTACEEVAPSIKEASLTEYYLALLGAAGVAGGLAGAYNGYQGASQKHRLAALSRVRHLQLAKRRNEDLTMVPELQPMPAIAEEEESDDPIKSAGLKEVLAKDVLVRAAGALGRGTGRAGSAATKALPAVGKAVVTKPLAFAKANPVTTALALGVGGAEAGGQIADRMNSSLGRWKPSQWITSRFRDNQPLRDFNGKPVWGTRRLFSSDPDDYHDMRWSWNPLAGLGSEGGWRGLGWRFRRQPNPRRVVLLPEVKTDMTDLIRNASPAMAMRRRMNEQFYSDNSLK